MDTRAKQSASVSAAERGAARPRAARAAAGALQLAAPDHRCPQTVLPLRRDVRHLDCFVRSAPGLVQLARPLTGRAPLPTATRHRCRHGVVVDHDPFVDFAGGRHSAVGHYALGRHGSRFAEKLDVPALRVRRRVVVPHGQRS